MPHLRYDTVPALDHPPLVAGFMGWPDAAEAASGAIAFLVRALSARRFASIDPEPFYHFGETRPTSVLLDEGRRTLSWPGGEFFAARDPSGRDLILFLGREPNVRWQQYLDIVLELLERFQGGPLVTLGGTYDRVSHRGVSVVSGWSPATELRATLATLGIRFAGYQGPASIQTALVDVSHRRGMPAASLWGHAPHYISAVANPKVARALVRNVVELFGLSVELDPLNVAALELEGQVEQALLGRLELQEYVRSLEERAAFGAVAEEMADPASHERIIRDVERFLHDLVDETEDEPG